VAYNTHSLQVHVRNTPRYFSNVIIMVTILTTLPFWHYVCFGVSWAGIDFHPEHKRKLHLTHIPLSCLWIIVSIFQMKSYKYPKIHSYVGRFTMFLLLPIWLLEIGLVATAAFWEKNKTIANWRFDTDTPNYFQLLVTIGVACPAILNNVVVLMNAIMSMNAIYPRKGHSKNILVHAYHMFAAITVSAGAGALRLQLHVFMRISECTWPGTWLVNSLFTFASFPLMWFLLFLLMTYLRMAIPVHTRHTYRSIDINHYTLFCMSVITCSCSWYCNIPLTLEC
jgi:hypothetical protein